MNRNFDENWEKEFPEAFPQTPSIDINTTTNTTVDTMISATSPQKALRKVLKDNGLFWLETCFVDLDFKSRKVLNKLLLSLKRDNEFTLQVLDELDSKHAGSISQFLKMCIDEKGTILYQSTHRKKAMRLFELCKDLGVMNFKTIDPLDHPDIQRHLNPCRFWYLIKHDPDKYKSRYQEQIESYAMAGRKIYKSAVADKQRIDEAKNGKDPDTKTEPEPIKANPDREALDKLFKRPLTDEDLAAFERFKITACHGETVANCRMMFWMQDKDKRRFKHD